MPQSSFRRVCAGMLVVAVACGGHGARAAGQPQAPKPPNVVVILVDDLGYGDVGYHGNPQVKTPAIDAFAAEAVEFTRFYVSPVCSPTRSSLLTGRWNFRTGVTSVFGNACWMDPAEVTIAERLRDAGYATGVFGKWHLGDEGERAPGGQGFEESLVHGGAALGSAVHRELTMSFPGAEDFDRSRSYFDPILLHNGVFERRSGYCMDIFTDAAIDFVRRQTARPFFVYLAANLIHTPAIPPPKGVEEFAAVPLTPATRTTYAMIRNLDTNVGRLLAALDDAGVEEDTLVIFTSDNGPCFTSEPIDRHMAGLRGLKGTVYENGIRVPCFVRWPAGFRTPAQIEEPAAHIDILPTVLEACGLAVPPELHLDGMSLLPWLRNPAAAKPERTIFLQWDGVTPPRRGIAYTAIRGRWKLVQPCGGSPEPIRDWYTKLCARQGRGEHPIDGPPRYELYDLVADPGETRDLAERHPDIVADLRQAYDAWFTDVCSRWQRKPKRE